MSCCDTKCGTASDTHTPSDTQSPGTACAGSSKCKCRRCGGGGLGHWLAQRLSAVILLVFALWLVLQVLLVKGPLDYDKWAGIFHPQWMKLFSFVAFAALGYHVWVGMRDVWMDYVKPCSVRLVLHALTAIWVLVCVGWAVQVLWRP